MCGKSDNLLRPDDPASPSYVYQPDDTMSRLGAGAAAGVVAGVAAGLIHNGLTGLYRNMTLGKVIAYVVHNNNEFGDVVNGTDISSADKDSIKAALDTINVKLRSVYDKIEDPRTLFKAINAEMEFIKEILGGRMPELMQGWLQAYEAIGPAVYNADSNRIHKQSVGAGLAVGATTMLGSIFANDIQTAIDSRFNPSSCAGQPPSNCGDYYLNDCGIFTPCPQ